MNAGRSLFALALWGCALGARADEIQICYNYACASSSVAYFRGAQLAQIRLLFAWVTDAESERDAIARAIGMFVAFAGQQTPTFRDKARNGNEDELDGRMDCIDHSRNNTAYLALMEARGWLKFHTVLDPVSRAPLIFNEHWSARIAESESGEEFVVDSWFFDHGHPPVIYAVEEWKTGAEPHE